MALFGADRGFNMYDWKEIKSDGDLPDDYDKEYLFYNYDGWYQVLNVAIVSDYREYVEEDGSLFYSSKPYWEEFNLTHWAELTPPTVGSND
jgi:hypothetical protein